MKKLLALLLALLMVFATFVSCNTSSSTDETSAPETTEEEVTTTAEETTAEKKPLSKVSVANILKSLDPNYASFASASGCREAVLSNFSKDSVIKAFTDEDFTEYPVSRIEGAKFETVVLTRSYNTVTLYCDSANEEVRVMWESDAKLKSLAPTEETGKGSITVAQVGTERVSESDNPLIGMCYVIKLSSGNAIVIDGGFNNEACANNLYNTLEKMEIAKSGSKYVIEAWIITHGHGDHAGTFKKFSSLYSTKAKVQNILLSYPPNDKLVVSGGKSFSTENFSSASLITPHAGLKYHFGNATISMFYTPDMLYTADSQLDYFNDTSLVFKIEGGDASVMFMADAGEVVSTELLASYEESALKSDIFQLSHHGLYTSANSTHRWTNQKKVYTAIDADYVFLPMQERLEGNSRNGRYTVLITWAAAKHQVSFVMNTSDKHGLSEISQSYYNSFVDSVKNGTATKPTLYGYDGINKIDNGNGLITYLGGNETDPMITIFELASNKVTLKTNKPLHEWIGK